MSISLVFTESGGASGSLSGAAPSGVAGPSTITVSTGTFTRASSKFNDGATNARAGYNTGNKCLKTTAYFDGPNYADSCIGILQSGASGGLYGSSTGYGLAIDATGATIVKLTGGGFSYLGSKNYFTPSAGTYSIELAEDGSGLLTATKPGGGTFTATDTTYTTGNYSTIETLSSTTKTFSSWSGYALVVSPPNAPTDLTFSSVTSTSVSVTVTPSGTGNAATGYKLYKKVNGAGSWDSPITQASAVFSVTGLSTNTLYDFYAVAYNGAGDSSAGATESQGTLNPASAGGGDLSSVNIITINSSGVYTTAENTTNVGAVSASTTSGDPLSYAIIGGLDAALFTINSAGIISFLSAPNFEEPGSSLGTNAYSLTIEVTDGSSLPAQQNVTVNVSNVADEITSLVVTSAASVSASVRTLFTVTVLATDGSVFMAGYPLNLTASKTGIISTDAVAVTNVSGVATWVCTVLGTAEPGSECTLTISAGTASVAVPVEIVPSTNGDIFFRGEWWPRTYPQNS